MKCNDDDDQHHHYYNQVGDELDFTVDGNGYYYYSFK